VTAVVMLVPVVVAAISLRAGSGIGLLVAGWIVALFVFTWLYWRPSTFTIGPEGLFVDWPMRSRHVPWSDIAGAEEVRPDGLRQEFGTLLRVGVGGLWGGFGLAWSSRGKHLGMYVSRHADGFVLVRCLRARSLLITPERPAAFVAEVVARSPAPAA
jgi:hypothetical protein